jgi:hypothetical protein
MIFPSKSRFLRKKMPEKFFVPSDGTYVSANGMYVPYRGIYVPAGGMGKISTKNIRLYPLLTCMTVLHTPVVSPV